MFSPESAAGLTVAPPQQQGRRTSDAPAAAAVLWSPVGQERTIEQRLRPVTVPPPPPAPPCLHARHTHVTRTQGCSVRAHLWADSGGMGIRVNSESVPERWPDVFAEQRPCWYVKMASTLTHCSRKSFVTFILTDIM